MSSSQTIKEEVGGIIQIVDGTCDGHVTTEHLEEKGVISVVERRVIAEAMKELKAPRDEVRECEQDEAPRYRQKNHR